MVCTEAETGSGAFAAAMRESPDVCLLDVDMLGGAIEAAFAIRSQLPQTWVGDA